MSDPSKALVVDLFTSWVLGTCATVDEVKDRLNRGEVEVWGDVVLEKEMPLHFPIHDEAGRSIVIEFIDGEIQIHDNPVAVLTNDPPFPWQITNIENYVGLSNDRRRADRDRPEAVRPDGTWQRHAGAAGGFRPRPPASSALSSRSTSPSGRRPAKRRATWRCTC